MLRDIAKSLILRCSAYCEPARYGLSFYEFWISSEEEIHPGVSTLIREVALDLIGSKDVKTVVSAIQALACTGVLSDIPSLELLGTALPDQFATEVSAAVSNILFRSKSLETLLDEVKDEATFSLFARALAIERERAKRIELLEPGRYCIDGALGWKNADIASFVFAGLSGIDSNSNDSHPTWARFAEFLYHGKIVE